MTDIVPDLPEIKTGEVYARLTEQAFNCRGNNIATDLTWYFQSLKKLGKGDLFIVGGNWVMQDLTAPAYIGGEYSMPLDLWIAAMKRGAKVALLTSYYYTGNPDDCDNTAPGALDHSNWGDTGITPCEDCGSSNYTTCHVACCSIKKLKAAGGSNFIDLRNTGPNQGPTSHSKFSAFYYFSRNEFSQFFGAWNPVIRGWPLKETGFGLYGKLDEDLGKLCNHWLYSFLTMVKNISSKESQSNYDLLQKIVKDPQGVKSPAIVPTLYFYGPDYCDSNFGCQMTDQWGTASRDASGCQDAQKYVTLVDNNVQMTLGIAPSILHHTSDCVGSGFPWDVEWGGKDSKLVDALTLMKNFIKNSKEFVKSSEMTQYMGIGTATDDNIDCNMADSVPQSLVQTLTESMKAGKPYLAIEGGSDGDLSAQGQDGCSKWGSDPNNFALAWRFACDKSINKNFAIKSYGFGNTHDKFWVSDNALILATGHPDTQFHLGKAYNYWLMFANCPNLTVWMNNHWNSMWENCCYFPGTSYNIPNSYLQKVIGQNSYYTNLGKAMCPSSSKSQGNCCFGDPQENIYTAKATTYPGWYGVPDIDKLRTPAKVTCEGVRCPDHSTCVVLSGKTNCNCDDGYTKQKDNTCIKTSNCKSINCPDNSTCVISDNKAICTCNSGYTKNSNGDCVKPETCKTLQCPQNSTCLTDGGVRCVCIKGYEKQKDGTCKTSTGDSYKTPILSIIGGIFLLVGIILLIIYLYNQKKHKTEKPL